nr:hypothetical protein BaRGS_000960 [Batillaria attramentaria]
MPRVQLDWTNTKKKKPVVPDEVRDMPDAAEHVTRRFSDLVLLPVKMMLTENKGQAAAEEIMKEQLALYVLSRPESVLEEDYFQTRLKKFSDRAQRKGGKEVCLVLDETGMNKKGSEKFFKESAFRYSLPASKFMTALKKEGVRAAVNTTRDEGTGDAPIPADDLILVTDIKAIHGLERAVIIIIPEHPNPQINQKEAQEEPMESSSTPQENANTEGAEALPQADDGEASPPASKIRREEEVTPHASSATAEVGQDEQMEEGEDQQGKGETDSAPMESVETGDTGDGSAAKTTEGSAQQEPAGACPAGQNLTYGGDFSEKEIKDALDTLTEQARRDIFYIGSRAVCQLVIFHHGKNPRK